MYKSYCNRRAGRQTQEPEATHCCPSRMPIIGPILFSLFIFSPFILPSSESANPSNLESHSEIKEPYLPDAPSQEPGKIKKEYLHNHQPLYSEDPIK